MQKLIIKGKEIIGNLAKGKLQWTDHSRSGSGRAKTVVVKLTNYPSSILQAMLREFEDRENILSEMDEQVDAYR